MILLTPDVEVALGILALNKYKGRRSITVNEYNLFTKYLQARCNFGQGTMNEEVQMAFEEYFDEITLEDGSLVYRLKSTIKIADLRADYCVLPMKIIKEVFRKEAVEGLNDLTKEDEDSLEEFKRIDEQYQLKTILEICNLEKKQREAEERLRYIQSITTSLIDSYKVEVILEKNQFLNEDDLIDEYYR